MNCGNTVAGRYCGECGQENVITHQSFLSLVKHFVYDVLHFDGKFFHTLLYLFTRPGFVAKQYVTGKRVSYLDPIRMYLFMSAVFFLVFFSINRFKADGASYTGHTSNEDRRELADYYQKKLDEHRGDTAGYRNRVAVLRDTTRPINVDSMGWSKNFITFGSGTYTTVAAYDSAQLAAPKKDSWLKQRFIRQLIKSNEKYGGSQQGLGTFFEALLHKLPYLLFVSLPFFAGILKLLYIRRKNFMYSDHAVFTFYHYVFSFILLLVVFGLVGLHDASHWSVLNILIRITLFAWLVYLYLEMKNFYGQGWGKTLVKFIGLNMVGSLLLLLLFIAFFIFSIFQV